MLPNEFDQLGRVVRIGRIALRSQEMAAFSPRLGPVDPLEAAKVLIPKADQVVDAGLRGRIVAEGVRDGHPLAVEELRCGLFSPRLAFDAEEVVLAGQVLAVSAL